jgi:hypothetical protein
MDCEPALLSLSWKEKKGYELPNTKIICTVCRLERYRQDDALFNLAPYRSGVAYKRSSPASQSVAQSEIASSDKEKDVVGYSRRIIFS